MSFVKVIYGTFANIDSSTGRCPAGGAGRYHYGGCTQFRESESWSRSSNWLSFQRQGNRVEVMWIIFGFDALMSGLSIPLKHGSEMRSKGWRKSLVFQGTEVYLVP